MTNRIMNALLSLFAATGVTYLSGCTDDQPELLPVDAGCIVDGAGLINGGGLEEEMNLTDSAASNDLYVRLSNVFNFTPTEDDVIEGIPAGQSYIDGDQMLAELFISPVLGGTYDLDAPNASVRYAIVIDETGVEYSTCVPLVGNDVDYTVTPEAILCGDNHDDSADGEFQFSYMDNSADGSTDFLRVYIARDNLESEDGVCPENDDLEVLATPNEGGNIIE